MVQDGFEDPSTFVVDNRCFEGALRGIERQSWCQDLVVLDQVEDCELEVALYHEELQDGHMDRSHKHRGK